jgi:two-component system sensor histidine kinase AlgZ
MLPFLHRYRVLLLHLSFWGVYCSFYFYQFAAWYGWRQALLMAVVPAWCNGLIAYFNYFYLLPRWLRHHQLWRYLLEFVPAFVVAVVLKTMVQRYLSPPSIRPSYLYSNSFLLSVVFGTLSVVLFVGALRFVVEWFALEAKTKALENEHLTAELRFLKAQINPHFLFNTLNNLYYLAYSQSPNTPEVVAKLAQMMRYMMDESNQPVVALSREIEYMQNYISLEKLRLNAPVPITFEVEGEAGTAQIAPLILMTFLENAFKHGISDQHAAAGINVRLQVGPTGCTYTVANRPASRPPGAAPGTGLLNVRRRLALSYPDRHTLHIDDTPDLYRIHLTLHLP